LVPCYRTVQIVAFEAIPSVERLYLYECNNLPCGLRTPKFRQDVGIKQPSDHSDTSRTAIELRAGSIVISRCGEACIESNVRPMRFLPRIPYLLQSHLYRRCVFLLSGLITLSNTNAAAGSGALIRREYRDSCSANSGGVITSPVWLLLTCTR
jgi:hypothetical protein